MSATAHIDELNLETRARVPKQIPNTEDSTTALATVEKQKTDPSAQLAKLEQACQMLAESRTLSDVKHVRDIAEAARVYAKAANLGHEAQNFAAEIALLAARKAGEILKTLEKKKSSGVSANIAGTSEYAKILKETGTAERTAQRWQEIAAVPQEKFIEYIKSVKPTGDITAAGLLKAAKPPHDPKPTDDQAIQTAQRLQDECRKVGLNVDVSVSRDPGKFHITYRNLSEAEIQQAIDATKRRIA